MMEKYGDKYLDISHAREIEFDNSVNPTARIIWADGKWEVFGGEAAKSLYLSLNPDDVTDPDIIGTVVATLTLNAAQKKWFVGVTDGIVKTWEQSYVETEDVLAALVPMVKTYLKRYSAKLKADEEES
ncbi:hypothetical protein [Laspinema palackyanum]|uniref:hypothetical protein n=1 Tax=Laspinema palackyanum TaxID=3231601 RepID=UPI00345C657C|nr:hypothetical protein [Laspinema sp. D2c]